MSASHFVINPMDIFVVCKNMPFLSGLPGFFVEHDQLTREGHYFQKGEVLIALRPFKDPSRYLFLVGDKIFGVAPILVHDALKRKIIERWT